MRKWFKRLIRYDFFGYDLGFAAKLMGWQVQAVSNFLIVVAVLMIFKPGTFPKIDVPTSYGIAVACLAAAYAVRQLFLSAIALDFASRQLQQAEVQTSIYRHQLVLMKESLELQKQALRNATGDVHLSLFTFPKAD